VRAFFAMTCPRMQTNKFLIIENVAVHQPVPGS
jgi:hypothetical protein